MVSQEKILQGIVGIPPINYIAYRVAKNWIAGKTINDAMTAAKNANSKNYSVILNHLGEEVEDKAEVSETIREYKSLIDSIEREKIDGCVSVKPTQLGLNIDADYCRKNIEEIVDYAEKANRFVWVDMESTKFTDATVDMYMSLHAKHKNTGVCIQTYLKRSNVDVEKIVKGGGHIRLVKGAYNEPAELAYKSKEDVDRNFVMLMDYLFKNSKGMFSVATHDDKIVDKAMELGKQYSRKMDTFEFGMLKGVRDSLKSELVKKGYKVTEYIPYGANWLPYSIRRVKEKPSNIILLGRSLISK